MTERMKLVEVGLTHQFVREKLRRELFHEKLPLRDAALAIPSHLHRLGMRLYVDQAGCGQGSWQPAAEMRFITPTHHQRADRLCHLFADPRIRIEHRYRSPIEILDQEISAGT